MTAFDVAFERLRGHEGGLSLDKNDKGNWTGGEVGKGELRGTKYGVSAASYPHLNIPELTAEEAKQLYLQDFWRPVGCDLVPASIRFDLFDLAVNTSAPRKPTFAIKLLQRTVGEVEDGVIGPATLQAINSMPPDRLRLHFSAHRRIHWASLSTFHRYGRTWTMRQAKNDLAPTGE